MTNYVNPVTRIGGVDQVVVADRVTTIPVDEAPFDDEQYVRVNGEWVSVTVPPPVPDTLAPDPPTSLSSTPSIASNGGSVDYTLTWVAPTTNTDTTALTDLAYYVVRWRYAGDSTWTELVANGTSTFIRGLRLGTNVDWNVLARDESGNDSVWASSTITGATDSVGPQTPSAPSLASRLGTIRVTWNGLDYVGGSPPADFQRLEVYIAAGLAGPWTYVDRLSGPGTVIVTSVPVGTTRYFSFIAYDTSGNASARSNPSSIIALGITGPDLEANSVTTNALAAGAVTAIKVEAEAITAEKIALGVLKRNLVNDPGFEDSYAFSLWDPFGAGQGEMTQWRLQSAGATAGRGPVRTTVSGRSRSGSKAVELTAGAGETACMVSNTFPVVPGKEYRVIVHAASLTSQGLLYIDLQQAATQNGITGFDANTTLAGDSVYALTPTLLTEPMDPESFDTFSWTFTAQTGKPWSAIRLYNANPAALSTIVIDDVSTVAVGNGGASELTAAGLRLFDDDGYEVTALVSNRRNYFSVQDKGVTLASINSGGNGAFQSVASATDIDVSGEHLVGSYFLDGLAGGADSPYPDSVLEQLPMGLVQWGGLYSSSGVSASTTGIGVMEISAPLYSNRLYKLCTNAIRVASTVANDAAELRVHATFATLGDPDAVPTTPLVASTPQMARSPITTINNVSGEAMTLTKLYSPSTTNTGHQFLRNARFLLAVARVAGSGNVSINGSSLDPIEFWIEDVGPFKPNGGQANAGGGATTGNPPQTYVKTWTSTTARCYMGSGALDSSQGASDMKQGYSSYDGDSKSLWIFPSMTSTLSGSTISRVRIYLYANHWYYNSGGTAVIKVHGYSTTPGSNPSMVTIATSTSWPKPGGRWVTLPNNTFTFNSVSATLYAHILAGRVLGIGVGPAGTNSLTYYGRFNRDGAKIEVTYKK
jgi:hypothetical protein